MMRLVRKIAESFFWGIGFASASILIFYSAWELDLIPGKNKAGNQKTPKIVDHHKIRIDVQKTSIFRERVIVTTTVENRNTYPVSLSFEALIFNEKNPIEQCDTLMEDNNFNAGESREIPIFCDKRWKTLIPENLSSSVGIQLAHFWDDGQ